MNNNNNNNNDDIDKIKIKNEIFYTSTYFC